jgi:transcriptional regulator with XRE-family HTH domain
MKSFAEIYESRKDTLEYQAEELSLAFTESVLLRMEERGNMPRKELANRMGTTMPYVTKLLKGKSNFTFETLVKLARALDCRIEAPTLIPLSRQQTGQGSATRVPASEITAEALAQES